MIFGHALHCIQPGFLQNPPLHVLIVVSAKQAIYSWGRFFATCHHVSRLSPLTSGLYLR